MIAKNCLVVRSGDESFYGDTEILDSEEINYEHASAMTMPLDSAQDTSPIQTTIPHPACEQQISVPDIHKLRSFPLEHEVDTESVDSLSHLYPPFDDRTLKSVIFPVSKETVTGSDMASINTTSTPESTETLLLNPASFKRPHDPPRWEVSTNPTLKRIPPIPESKCSIQTPALVTVPTSVVHDESVENPTVSDFLTPMRPKFKTFALKRRLSRRVSSSREQVVPLSLSSQILPILSKQHLPPRTQNVAQNAPVSSFSLKMRPQRLRLG
jgi:hypothetical protein